MQSSVATATSAIVPPLACTFLATGAHSDASVATAQLLKLPRTDSEAASAGLFSGSVCFEKSRGERAQNTTIARSTSTRPTRTPVLRNMLLLCGRSCSWSTRSSYGVDSLPLATRRDGPKYRCAALTAISAGAGPPGSAGCPAAPNDGFGTDCSDT
uniref:Putative secreted protein n=1 Tax=Ixodes ricinus TaxID=34613 RepID=A0A6B0UWI9_IXORI